MEYKCIWELETGRNGLDGLRPSWATERGSGCICSAYVDQGPFVAWTLIKSQIYCPEHILAYGGGKTCFSHVMGSGSFRTSFLGWLYILG
jgi:hypothetical protein